MALCRSQRREIFLAKRRLIDMGQCSIDLLHLYDLGMDDLNADRAAVIRVFDHENLTEPLRSGASIVRAAREETDRPQKPSRYDS